MPTRNSICVTLGRHLQFWARIQITLNRPSFLPSLNSGRSLTMRAALGNGETGQTPGGGPKSPRPSHTYSPGSDSKPWQSPARPVGLRSLKITLWCLALILSVHFVKNKTKHIELRTGKSKQWKEMMETLWFLSSGTVSVSEGGMSYSPRPLPPIMLLRSGYKTESRRSQKKKTKNFWRFIFA